MSDTLITVERSNAIDFEKACHTLTEAGWVVLSACVTVGEYGQTWGAILVHHGASASPAAAFRLERVVERFESRARHVIPGTMSLDDLWAWAERIETFIEGKKKPDKQTDGE